MDVQVERLTNKVWENYQQLPPSRRLLIAISGIPGSGKTTLAATVTKRLNALHQASSRGTTVTSSSSSFPSSGAPTDIAAFIPMDGYHLTRAQLSAMPDPAHAHARRGAAFTFDGHKFLSLVQTLCDPLTSSTPTFYAPSFDHAVKDPVDDDVPIAPTARVVLFEGNYLSLDKEPWNQAAALMDELWFVEVGFERARERLVKRHVKAGIARDEVEAHKRVTENDLVNGREIVEGRLPVHEIVESREDTAWAPEAQGTGV